MLYEEVIVNFGGNGRPCVVRIGGSLLVVAKHTRGGNGPGSDQLIFATNVLWQGAWTPTQGRDVFLGEYRAPSGQTFSALTSFVGRRVVFADGAWNLHQGSNFVGGQGGNVGLAWIHLGESGSGGAGFEDYGPSDGHATINLAGTQDFGNTVFCLGGRSIGSMTMGKGTLNISGSSTRINMGGIWSCYGGQGEVNISGGAFVMARSLSNAHSTTNEIADGHVNITGAGTVLETDINTTAVSGNSYITVSDGATLRTHGYSSGGSTRPFTGIYEAILKATGSASRIDLVGDILFADRGQVIVEQGAKLSGRRSVTSHTTPMDACTLIARSGGDIHLEGIQNTSFEVDGPKSSISIDTYLSARRFTVTGGGRVEFLPTHGLGGRMVYLNQFLGERGYGLVDSESFMSLGTGTPALGFLQIGLDMHLGNLDFYGNLRVINGATIQTQSESPSFFVHGNAEFLSGALIADYFQPITVSGTLTLTENFSYDVDPTTLAYGHRVPLFKVLSGQVIGTMNPRLTGIRFWRYSLENDMYIATVAATPEPASLISLAAGMGAILTRRSSRKGTRGSYR